MKTFTTIISIFISSALFGQLVRIDSTLTNKRVNYYNQLGYFIGSDSVIYKEVRATQDGGDTFKIPSYTLIERTYQRFITIDSLAPYLKIVELDEKVEDKIGQRLVAGNDIDITYNDATGECTIDFAGSGGGGLNSEAVFDTIAYTIRVGEGLKKQKSDSGDSLLIELKLKDALEQIVWSTGCHKSVFMATNTTGGTAHWGFQITATGTVGSPNKSTTNKFQYSNRWETLVTSASTTAVAGFRTNAWTHGFGNTSGMGGFYFNGVAGPATGCSNTTSRFFFGMGNSLSAPTDVDPSTLGSLFGIAFDDDDSNLQFIYNDAAGTATKIDLGSNFPVGTSDRTDFY